MSIEIVGRCVRLADASSVVEELAMSDFVSSPELPASGPWPQGLTNTWRHGISTRKTQVTLENDRISVRIFTLATEQDCELALKLLQAFGMQGPIDADELGQFQNLDELAPRLASEFAKARIDSGARALEALIEDGRGPIQVPGPNRSVFVGPNVLRRLRSQGDDLGAQLMNLIRHVQWEIDPIYEQASVFVAEPGEKQLAAGAEPEKEISLVIWLPNRAIVMPGVEQVVVQTSGKEIVIIPFSSMPGLAGDAWHLIDESQGCIDAIAGKDWEALVVKSREFAIAQG